MNEFDREGFGMEFDTWDEFTEFLHEHGAAFSGQRVRIGDYAIQLHPHRHNRFQVAHRRFKGNVAREEK